MGSHSRDGWMVGSWLVVFGVVAMPGSVVGQTMDAESTGPEGAGAKSDVRRSDRTKERKVLESTADLEKWLQRYSTDVGVPTTMEELSEYARESAPAVGEARERVGFGRAEIAGAEKFQPSNPRIEGEMGVGLGGAGLKKAETAVKQTFEVAGERGLRIEAARAREKALERRVDRAEWRVHARVHRLYRVGLVGRKRVELERRILEFNQELLGIARQRVEAGEEPETTVIVSRAELASTRQHLVDEWRAYLETVRELGTTVGWDREQPPQPTGELEAPRRVPSTERLVERAHENDPKLAELRARLEEARHRVKLARREVWPNPTVGIGHESENIGTPRAGSHLRVLAGLPLPLWDRNQGKVARATTQVRVVEERIANRKRTLENEVAKQVRSVEAAYQQAQIYRQKVLPALEKQLTLLREGFELGELSLLDVMNARDRLLDVQREHFNALEEYVRAVSELEKLLGTSIWKSKSRTDED